MSSRLPQFDEAEWRFVSTRQKVGHIVTPLLWLLLVVVVGGAAFCYVRIPHLGNPWYVIESLQQDAVARCNLYVMAALTPLLVQTVAFLLVVITIVILTTISLERRYHGMLRRFRDGGHFDDGEATPDTE